jgi:hypothetical protein
MLLAPKVKKRKPAAILVRLQIKPNVASIQIQIRSALLHRFLPTAPIPYRSSSSAPLPLPTPHSVHRPNPSQRRRRPTPRLRRRRAPPLPSTKPPRLSRAPPPFPFNLAASPPSQPIRFPRYANFLHRRLVKPHSPREISGAPSRSARNPIFCR